MYAISNVQLHRRVYNVLQQEGRCPQPTYRIVLPLVKGSTITAVEGVGSGSKPSKEVANTNYALAINSAHSITESQIHLHFCKPSLDMQTFLSGRYTGSPSAYSTLKEIQSPIPPGAKMFCRASQTKGQDIPGASIFNDINAVLTIVTDVCQYFVGAAVIKDKNGYSWVCVTGDQKSTEYQRFCA
ncbi:hypothetical protein N7486_002384 [Penicillium sp. IBT 16267x]|nr:hypothetical protein N7486_002384 [Penicillium sp. IBT 16267x]